MWTPTTRAQHSPTDGSPIALAGAITGDAVADPVDAAEFLDVDVDQIAWLFAFVAHDKAAGDQGRTGDQQSTFDYVAGFAHSYERPSGAPGCGLLASQPHTLSPAPEGQPP